MNGPIPLNEIPTELIYRFTLNRRINISEMFIDESCPNNIGSSWSQVDLDTMRSNVSNERINTDTTIGEPYCYGGKLILQTIKKYNIENKNVAVIGTLIPWIECILLNNNVKNITTVDYNKLTFENNIIKSLSYDEFVNNTNVYDVIISYSSIEHSGLGRYGDEINPDGDLDAMNIFYNKLSNNGFIFLGIPVGPDSIVFNAHRIYGEMRLNYIFQKYKEIEWFGFDKKQINNVPYNFPSVQPIIVLKKK
jgi:hypothetical protein